MKIFGYFSRTINYGINCYGKEKKIVIMMSTYNNDKKSNYNMSHKTKCMKKRVCDRIFLNKFSYFLFQEKKEKIKTLFHGI